MNVRPLIVRELRAEARRANTYWVRTVAAGLLTALFVWMAWDFRGDGTLLGPMLFEALSYGFLLAVLAIVSGITADSISREKREGTLGLLFLTPLTPRDIVIGKALLHALRAVSIFLAMAPIAGLPFLLGGIPASSVLFFIVGLPVAVMIAVASGILATVSTREWVESIVWAQLIWIGTLLALWLSMIIVFLALQKGGLTRFYVFFAPVMMALCGFSMIAFGLARAGRKLEENWQEEDRAHESRWVKFFSESTFWRMAFSWDTRKARDRNPIAWLQEYNWGSRLTKWGWCFIIFFAQWKLIFGWRQYMGYQLQLCRLVALGIAFSAAASFRRERQTGALELLLVTPISAGKLILGRLQGVWFHFFPAIAILAAVWNSSAQMLALPLSFSWYLVAAYICVPIIGFYCSLLTSNVLVAWLLTLFFGQYLPYAITQAFRFEIGRANLAFANFTIAAVFATVSGLLLYDNLTKRRFVVKS